MNDFVGMEELLQDFLMEAGDMLSDVDSKLMELEKNPGRRRAAQRGVSRLSHHQGRRGIPQCDPNW